MKKILMMTAIAAMMASPALAADDKAAAPLPGYTFGIVDMTKVVKETDAAKDILKQWEGKRKEYQAQVTKGEESLRTANDALVKEKDKLSKEALADKGRAFDEKVRKWKIDAAEHNRILEVAMAGAMSQLRRESAGVVASIAKERQYSAVFTQDAVMISRPELDLTPLVIEKMNKDVKNIPIDWAAAEKVVSTEAGGDKKK